MIRVPIAPPVGSVQRTPTGVSVTALIYSTRATVMAPRLKGEFEVDAGAL
ncbi:hypothetical protein [Mycolicibacterium sp. XJ870]